MRNDECGMMNVRQLESYHSSFRIHQSSLFASRLFLQSAEQRELLRARQLRRALNLHLCDLVCVDARDADTLRMHGPHDLERVAVRLAEDFFQDLDDELHRREVVVVQEDAEERGLLQLLPALCGDLLVQTVLALRHG